MPGAVFWLHSTPFATTCPCQLCPDEADKAVTLSCFLARLADQTPQHGGGLGRQFDELRVAPQGAADPVKPLGSTPQGLLGGHLVPVPGGAMATEKLQKNFRSSSRLSSAADVWFWRVYSMVGRARQGHPQPTGGRPGPCPSFSRAPLAALGLCSAAARTRTGKSALVGRLPTARRN